MPKVSERGANGPVGTQTDSPARGGVGKRTGRWVNEHKPLVVGIIVVVLGLLYLLRRNSPPTGAGATEPNLTPGNPAGTGTPDTTADALQAILSGQAGLGAILTSIQTKLGTPPTSSPATKPIYHAVGTVGQTYSLRQLAADYSGSTNPNTIESYLRGIIALNPDLRGKTSVPGGYHLYVPPTPVH